MYYFLLFCFSIKNEKRVSIPDMVKGDNASIHIIPIESMDIIISLN